MSHRNSLVTQSSYVGKGFLETTHWENNRHHVGWKKWTDTRETVRLFKDLYSVIKPLQRDNLTCFKDKALFDVLIEEYPNAKERLSATAEIDLNSEFETLRVKIQ